tara:strand:- start:1309 stop:1482 length:174 start_codon:yes stop_codon:yes gene_type:complete
MARGEESGEFFVTLNIGFVGLEFIAVLLCALIKGLYREFKLVLMVRCWHGSDCASVD